MRHSDMESLVNLIYYASNYTTIIKIVSVKMTIEQLLFDNHFN